MSLTPYYLRQTLALAPTDVPRVHAAARAAQDAIPGPITRVRGSHASLTEWMWVGIAVAAVVIDAVLTISRD
jgi:hypothetical protein